MATPVAGRHSIARKMPWHIGVNKQQSGLMWMIVSFSQRTSSRSSLRSKNYTHPPKAAIRTPMTDGIKTEHSPLPWIANEVGDIAPTTDEAGEGYWIAHLEDCGPRWKANAAFIVRAANCHDELVAVVEQYANYIRLVAKADDLEAHPYLPYLEELLEK